MERHTETSRILPLRALPCVTGLALVLWCGFSFFGTRPVEGSTSNVTVCVTKSKNIVSLTTRKNCLRGEIKTVLSTSAKKSPELCVHPKTKLISITAQPKCTAGKVSAAQFTRTSFLKACVNSKTRRVLLQSKSRCSKGFASRKFPLRIAGLTTVDETSTTVPTSSIFPTTTTIHTTVSATSSSSTSSTTSSTTTTSTSTTVPATTTSSTTTSTTVASTTTTVPVTTTTVPPAAITTFSAASTTINQGDSTTLSTTFQGSSALINQSVGSIANGGSVTVTPNSTTTYTLTVSNGAGHSINQFLTVYVNRLSITVQPQDITTDNPYGQNLTVTASASGALSYQWYKDAAAISNANSSSYRATQDGAYHVVITSTLNGVSRTATSSSATFYMNTVSISLQPVAALVAEGDTNTFSVAASGSGTLSYQWKRNGTDVSGATTSSFTSGTYGSHLVIVTSTLNGHTTSVTSNSVLLDVNTVTITHSPSNAYMTQGGTASLGVTVSSHGSATISYQWYLDGNELPGENDIGVYAAQAGEYKVKVTSVRGGTTFSRFSDVATVTEVPPPSISSFSAASSSIAIGNSTQLTAVFSGGSGTITPGNIAVSSGDTVTVSPTTSTSYTLTVVNPAGTQSGHTIRITVTTGTFTATANNSTVSRYSSAKAITLPSGKVVVFGSSDYTNVTDVFDPNTNSFTRVGNMNRGRHRFGAALLSNGKVLAIGGMYSSGATYYSIATVEIFDPVTETWSYTGSLNVARENPVVVVLNNGKVLVTGGMMRATGTTYLASAEIYDPDTGTFTYVNSMPQARGSATGALMSNGNVFVAGGYNSSNGQMKSAVIYNPTLNTWTSISSQMNSLHSEGGAVTLLLQDGRMLIAGGWSPSLGVWTIDIYNPTTNSFVAAANLPQFSHGRGGITGHVRSDGVVVFFGGSSGDGAMADTAVLYDPTSNTMATEGNVMRWSRYNHASTVLNDGRILIIGGDYFNSTAADIYSP